MRAPAKVFHAVTHVWGRQYLDLFLDVGLPNQLSPGNILALPAGSRYRILTRAAHVDEIDAHPNVRNLRAVIPTDIVVVDALERSNGLAQQCDLMIACHQQAVDEAIAARAAIVFLSADVVFSEGAFDAVVRRHREGYRAVVCTGLRLSKERFLPTFDPAARWPSRDLVRHALPYLHPQERDLFHDAQPSIRLTVAIYWRAGESALLARCLSLHPLMVDPMIERGLTGAADSHFVAEVCADPSSVHVVTDSDELQIFEMTAQDRIIYARTKRPHSYYRTALRAMHCDDLQLRNWRAYSIRIHDGGGDWRSVEAVANAFARNVVWAIPAVRIWHWWKHARRRLVFTDKRKRHLKRYLRRTGKRTIRWWTLTRKRLPRNNWWRLAARR